MAIKIMCDKCDERIKGAQYRVELPKLYHWKYFDSEWVPDAKILCSKCYEDYAYLLNFFFVEAEVVIDKR